MCNVLLLLLSFLLLTACTVVDRLVIEDRCIHQQPISFISTSPPLPYLKDSSLLDETLARFTVVANHRFDGQYFFNAFLQISDVIYPVSGSTSLSLLKKKIYYFSSTSQVPLQFELASTSTTPVAFFLHDTDLLSPLDSSWDALEAAIDHPLPGYFRAPPSECATGFGVPTDVWMKDGSDDASLIFLFHWYFSNCPLEYFLAFDDLHPDLSSSFHYFSFVSHDISFEYSFNAPQHSSFLCSPSTARNPSSETSLHLFGQCDNSYTLLSVDNCVEQSTINDIVSHHSCQNDFFSDQSLLISSSAPLLSTLVSVNSSLLSSSDCGSSSFLQPFPVDSSLCQLASCSINQLAQLLSSPTCRIAHIVPDFEDKFGFSIDGHDLVTLEGDFDSGFSLSFEDYTFDDVEVSFIVPLSELEFLQPKVFIESTNLISINQFSILASINVSNIGNLEGNLTVICNCFGNNVVISNYFYEILAVNETMEMSFLIESFEDTIPQDFSCQISSLFDSLPLWEQSNLTASWEFDIFTAEFPENCFYPELVPISFVQNNMCEIFNFEPFLCQTRQDWIDGDEVSDCLTINQNDWIPYYELLSDQEQLSYKNYLFKNISVQFLVFEHSEKIPFKLVIEAETCPGDTCHDVIFTTSQSTEFFTEKLELVSSFPENLIEFSFVVGVDYSLYKDDDLTLKFSLEILADPPCDCWLIDKTLGKSLTFDSITFPVSCPNPLLPSNVLNIVPSSPLWNDGVISYNENIIFNSIKNGPLFLTANSFDKNVQIIDGSHVFLHLSNINFEILNIGPTDTLVTALFNISSQNLDYFEISDFDLIGDVSFDCSSTFSIVIDELSGSLSCVLPAGQSILIGLNISTPYLTEFSANISIFPEKLLCMDDSYGGIISHYFNLIANCNENYPEKSKFSIELADFAFKSDNCEISDQNFSPCFNSSLTISNLASFDIEGNFELFCWNSEDQSIPMYPSSYTLSLPFFQSNLIEIVAQTVPGTELFCNVTVNTDPSVLHNPCSNEVFSEIFEVQSNCPNPLLPSNVLNIVPSSPLWNDGVISYNENIIFNSIKNGPLFLTANSFDKNIQIIDGSHVFLHLSNINFEILNIGPTDTLVTAMFNISSQNLDYFEVSDFDLIGDVSFDWSSTFSIVIDELSGSLSGVLPAGQSILIGLNISSPYLTEFSANISIFPEKLLCMDDSYGGIISHYFNLIANCNENYPEKSKFSIELADFAFKSDNCEISDQNFSPCFNSSLTISNLASFDIEGNFELFCWNSEDQSIPMYPSSYTFSLPFLQSNLIEIVTQTVPGTELFCNVTVNTDPSVLHNPCSNEVFSEIFEVQSNCPNPLLPSNVLNIDPSSPLWNDGVISYNENIIFNSIKNGPLFLTANSFDKNIQIIDGSHVFLHLSNINFEILNIGPTDTLVTAMFNISSQNLDYFEISDFDLIGDVSFDCSSTFSIVIDELSGSLSCVLPAGQSILIGLNISTPYLTEFSANISIFPEKLLCMDDSYGGIISHYFNLIANCNENYPEKSKFSIELADFAFKSDNCEISDQNFSPCFNSSLTISNLASFDIEGNLELFCWNSEDQSIPVYPSSYTLSLPFFQSNLIEIVAQTVPGTELFCNVTVSTDPSVLHNPCSNANHFSLLTSVDCVADYLPSAEFSIYNSVNISENISENEPITIGSFSSNSETLKYSIEILCPDLFSFSQIYSPNELISLTLNEIIINDSFINCSLIASPFPFDSCCIISPSNCTIFTNFLLFPNDVDPFIPSPPSSNWPLIFLIVSPIIACAFSSFCCFVKPPKSKVHPQSESQLDDYKQVPIITSILIESNDTDASIIVPDDPAEDLDDVNLSRPSSRFMQLQTVDCIPNTVHETEEEMTQGAKLLSAVLSPANIGLARSPHMSPFNLTGDASPHASARTRRPHLAWHHPLPR
ncbi:hypothetical protein RCL1_004891 [Eukaryota sp. TZLM3-RCL]